MSQHDFNIANQSFPATRTDLNNALAALASTSSGDAEPSTTYANQLWYETDTDTLKIRNEANNGWVTVLTLDTGVTATATELNYNDVTTLGLSEASKVVTADANGVVTLDNGFSEEYAAVTSTSNTVSLNLQTANNFSHTLTEDTTVSFTNPAASGKVSAATLRVIQDSTARAITWNAAIKWGAATAPTLSTASGAVDVFVFYTVDGGTTYYGFTSGQALA
tara:strand:- start:28 stop:690 length:663 start_codon:yes stop_codon:yes gene_type:complete